jgi:DnaJ-class molecular chaperone
MKSKDYYTILEVSSTASQEDIKKSYRRLAMKYHPDKNADSKVSELKFKEIQEAYKVLSDSRKRQQYNHNRYDEAHGLNKKPSSDAATPQAILQKSMHLRKKMRLMDPHRIDRDKLFSSIQLILSANNQSVLIKFNDQQTNSSIIHELLEASEFLQYKQSKQVSLQLSSLAGTNTNLQQIIQQFEQKQKLNYYWNRYQFLVALIAAALFCFLIYQLSA